MLPKNSILVCPNCGSKLFKILVTVKNGDIFPLKPKDIEWLENNPPTPGEKFTCDNCGCNVNYLNSENYISEEDGVNNE